MATPKVHICGKSDLYIPDTECTDCEKLEKRVKDLEDTRLVQSDILAGDNISVDYAEDSNEVTVNADLSDYYTKDETYAKTETYTKTEVDNLIGAIETSHFEVVQTLPQTGATNVIYLLENGTAYDQYIYTEDDGWVMIGSTQITLDKASILAALGYREEVLTIVDNSSTLTIQRTVLVEDI